MHADSLPHRRAVCQPRRLGACPRPRRRRSDPIRLGTL